MIPSLVKVLLASSAMAAVAWGVEHQLALQWAGDEPWRRAVRVGLAISLGLGDAGAHRPAAAAARIPGRIRPRLGPRRRPAGAARVTATSWYDAACERFFRRLPDWTRSADAGRQGPARRDHRDLHRPVHARLRRELELRRRRLRGDHVARPDPGAVRDGLPLAARHLPVPACRVHAPDLQHAGAVDVRGRPRTPLGPDRVPALLLRVRDRRRPDLRRGRPAAAGHGRGHLPHADDRRVGRDLRPPPRLRDLLPEPDHLLLHLPDPRADLRAARRPARALRVGAGRRAASRTSPTWAA